MQAPTGNVISQGQHGTTKAVDHSYYRNTNDDKVYAPEDGVIDSYQRRGSGKLDAGNCLRMKGANGLHQFAHLSKSLVSPGQVVKRGQAIAVMGATGYTIPAGAKHLHYWIQRPNGSYVYPPTLYTEAFRNTPVPAPSTGMPPIGGTVKNSVDRTFYKRNSAVSLGVVKAPSAYKVLGYDQKFPGSVWVHSASKGDARLALYYVNGARIEGTTW